MEPVLKILQCAELGTEGSINMSGDEATFGKGGADVSELGQS